MITGASNGIGRAIAAQVAARGINVALAARNRQELQAIARDLRDAHHVETIVIAVDLVDPGAASHLEDQLSDLDVGLVVLAAGFGTIGAFADAPLDRELEMIAVNITAVTSAGAHLRPPACYPRPRCDRAVRIDPRLVAYPGRRPTPPPRPTCRASPRGYNELATQGVDVLSVAPGPVHSGFAARAEMTMNRDHPQAVARTALAGLGRR